MMMYSQVTLLAYAGMVMVPFGVVKVPAEYGHWPAQQTGVRWEVLMSIKGLLRKESTVSCRTCV